MSDVYDLDRQLAAIANKHEALDEEYQQAHEKAVKLRDQYDLEKARLRRQAPDGTVSDKDAWVRLQIPAMMIECHAAEAVTTWMERRMRTYETLTSSLQTRYRRAEKEWELTNPRRT